MTGGDSPDSSTTEPSPLAADKHLPGLDRVEHDCWQHFDQSAARIFDILQRKLLNEHNFTLFDLLLLKILATSSDGSARMGDLADALALIPSRVTQQATRLEARGLLTRSTSAQDRRVVLATITQAGRARLNPALQTYARVVRTHYLNPLSRQQMTALGDSCRRVGTGLMRHNRRENTPPL